MPKTTKKRVPKKQEHLNIPIGDLKYVGSSGPRDASIVFIGEAPGSDEEKQGLPFIGYTGQFLRERCAKAGLRMDDIYITNVCHYRPPYNKIEKFIKSFGDGKKNVCNNLILEGVVELYKDLAEIKPKLVVPLGNVALWALTGKMKISKRRSSIMKIVPNISLLLQLKAWNENKFKEVLSALAKIQNTKVVPCLHPSGVTRKISLRPLFDFDLARIKEESQTREVVLPERTLHLNPDQEKARELVRTLVESGRYTFDIECPAGRLYCVGFACSRDWGLTLTYDDPWKRSLIQFLLEHEKTEKIAQNGMFDVWFLRVMNHITVKNWTYDTMVAQRIAYPDMDVGLDFQTSFYTREPYYKDDGKSVDLSIPKDIEQFLGYNAKDAIVTKEIEEQQMADEMQDEAVFNQVKHKMQMAQIAVEMEIDGWKINKDTYARLRQEHEKVSIDMQSNLDKAVIVHLTSIIKTDKTLGPRALVLLRKIATNIGAKKPGFNIGSTGEGNIVDEYLYGIRGFKPQYNKDTGKRTTNEEALKELYGSTGDPITLLIVKKRQEDKLLTTELSVKIDPNSRTYFSINPARTKTCRWAFTSNIFGYGCNGQAWHPKAKEMVEADDGWMLINADLAQVEDRMVSNIAGIYKKIEAFEKGIDVHSLTAQNIFGGTIDEIRAEHKSFELQGKQGPRRYLGKQSNHSFNYGEGPFRFAKRINKDADETGVRITDREGKRIRLAHLNAYPELEWYWQDIEGRIRNDHCLINLFGWKRTFYGAITDEVLRDAYSWIPQSSAPHIIDLGMLAIKEAKLPVRFLLHGHDSILCQVPANEAEDLRKEIVKLMLIPFEINGKEIIVPVDSKVGKNWRDLK